MEKIVICKTCGNIDTQNPCTVCTDARRDQSIIVVVADVADLWALERAHAVNGRYHVLGGTLSPLDGVGPQDLTIDALISRAHEPQVKELILALNATVDGQTTAHYITELLQDANVKVTRLAHGVPVGGELDYLDEGTLSAAIKQRTLFFSRVLRRQPLEMARRACSQASSTQARQAGERADHEEPDPAGRVRR